MNEYLHTLWVFSGGSRRVDNEYLQTRSAAGGGSRRVDNMLNSITRMIRI
jgi:hypothetical protein